MARGAIADTGALLIMSQVTSNTPVMSNPTTKNPPSYFAFQPASYWDESDPLSTILRHVKGSNRRQMITDFWNQDRFAELDPILMADSISPEVRRELGAIHPSFMGGEYLPDFLPTEVEIARIELQSTTSDVSSIRARRHPKDELIHYRIVDEYENIYEIQRETSTAPLTQGELIALIDTTDCGLEGGPAHCCNLMNYNETGEAEPLRHFTTVSSTFYPELFEHYDDEHEEWVTVSV